MAFRALPLVGSRVYHYAADWFDQFPTQDALNLEEFIPELLDHPEVEDGCVIPFYAQTITCKITVDVDDSGASEIAGRIPRYLLWYSMQPSGVKFLAEGHGLLHRIESFAPGNYTLFGAPSGDAAFICRLARVNGRYRLTPITDHAEIRREVGFYSDVLGPEFAESVIRTGRTSA